MIKLDRQFIDALMAERETGMGFHITDVTLKNGQTFNRVAIFGCDTVMGVAGRNVVPFTAPEIESIKVTHDRWNP